MPAILPGRFRAVARRLRAALRDERWSSDGRGKHEGELAFWIAELREYVAWYRGGPPLHGVPAPARPRGGADDAADDVRAALEAWLHLFQMPNYLDALGLPADAFAGQRVLDVGCGPFPSLLAFRDCARIGVEPLARRYQEAGYPLDEWSKHMTYCASRAEDIPLPSRSVDAVVSVNAIDHLDDFAATAREIRRVLATGGTLHMHVHYHAATPLEPMALSDAVFLEHYAWVPGLRKIRESNVKDLGHSVARPGDTYVLWANR